MVLRQRSMGKWLLKTEKKNHILFFLLALSLSKKRREETIPLFFDEFTPFPRSLSPFSFFPSPLSMGEQGTRRASAHVERESSGFDLAGLTGGGTSGVRVGGGGSAAGAAERRRSTSFLPSSTLHGPETLVNDEDNELFMSDEFRMYCYKVRIGALLFFLSFLSFYPCQQMYAILLLFRPPRPGSQRTKQCSDPCGRESFRPPACPGRVLEARRRGARRALAAGKPSSTPLFFLVGNVAARVCRRSFFRFFFSRAEEAATKNAIFSSL